MNKNLYKYVAATHLDKVLATPEGATLKCSRPKDFKDPYELFLTIDFRETPKMLAFYRDVIGQIPQLPTTCFSRSPIVIPMWAHYAQDSHGFVIELDEGALAKAFPESGFGDVDYRDAADNDLAEVLHRAYEIGKPRYLFLLQEGVFSAAYYTKAKCWGYESERRMVVRENEVRMDGESTLMDVPGNCVRALIAGPRASSETVRALRAKAEELGCSYYDLRIGRTSPDPYLVGAKGGTFEFDETAIRRSARRCASCKEPIKVRAKRCSWCRIDESHERDAAGRNTFRLLARAGVLDGYLKDMQAVSAGGKVGAKP
jgi:hypothetical protein